VADTRQRVNRRKAENYGVEMGSMNCAL